MGRLIYSLNVSLDGFVETVDHRLDWANVDEELHAWFNDQTRTLDAALYGRRMYQTMAGYWPTAESDPAGHDVERDFARIWNALPRSCSPGPSTPWVRTPGSWPAMWAIVSRSSATTSPATWT